MKYQLSTLEKIQPSNLLHLEEDWFGSWLADPKNLVQLSTLIGPKLAYGPVSGAKSAPRSCIVLHDVTTRQPVYIHPRVDVLNEAYLAGLFRYLTQCDSGIFIWVATAIEDNLKETVRWFNEITKENVQFFALRVEFWHIGTSIAAPIFHVECAPADWKPNPGLILPTSRSIAIKTRQFERDDLDDSFNDAASRLPESASSAPVDLSQPIVENRVPARSTEESTETVTQNYSFSDVAETDGAIRADSTNDTVQPVLQQSEDVFSAPTRRDVDSDEPRQMIVEPRASVETPHAMVPAATDDFAPAEQDLEVIRAVAGSKDAYLAETQRREGAIIDLEAFAREHEAEMGVGDPQTDNVHSANHARSNSNRAATLAEQDRGSDKESSAAKKTQPREKERRVSFLEGFLHRTRGRSSATEDFPAPPMNFDTLSDPPALRDERFGSGSRRWPQRHVLPVPAAWPTDLDAQLEIITNYWKELNELIAQRRGALRPTLAFPQMWITFPTGHPDYVLAAELNPENHVAFVKLRLSGESSPEDFAVLEMQREELEHKIGQSLLWQRTADERVITAERHDIDITSPRDWRTTQQWMADVLEQMYLLVSQWAH